MYSACRCAEGGVWQGGASVVQQPALVAGAACIQRSLLVPRPPTAPPLPRSLPLPPRLQWRAPSRSLFAATECDYQDRLGGMHDQGALEGYRWPECMHRPSDFQHA